MSNLNRTYPFAVNSRKSIKVLIVRTDRIGDVILTIPVITELKRNISETKISFLIQSYTSGLVAHHPDLEKVLLYDERGPRKSFLQMYREIRAEEYEYVVLVHPTFRLALLMFLARIPMRIGTGYRWYSLLFNKRIYEHRKTAEKHEAEYNLSLLRALGCELVDPPKPELHIGSKAVQRVDRLRREFKLSDSDTVVILHPGSGGSTRDWPAHRFGELASRLVDEGCKVAITGGKGEDKLVEVVAKAARSKAMTFVDSFSLEELAEFIRRAQLFVSNSTGPLHIAAAVGTPVIGFYPPILACSSKRWGPLADRKVIFEPMSKDCPRCKGQKCQGNDCMSLIKTDDVFSAARSLLEERTPVSTGSTA